jgi:hypothetical protein
MNALLERCSPSLVERLGGRGGQTLALERIRQEVRQMPYPQRQILLSQFGIDTPALDITTIADRLGLPPGRVDELLEQALVDLGFALIGAAPADISILGIVGPFDQHAKRGWKEVAA